MEVHMTITLDTPTQRQLEERARRQGKNVEELAATILAVSLLEEPASSRENELLAKITEGLSASFWSRKKALDAKADDFQLTEAEYGERLALQSQLEGWYLDRMQSVLELAQLWGEAPHALMKRLGTSSQAS
jgi:hypothetical protein